MNPASNLTPALRNLLTFALSLIVSSGAFAELVLVYDNQVSVVNNGRVNDPDYPGFLMHADSFSLSSNAVISQVSWLGAYKGGNLLPDGSDNFTIMFLASKRVFLRRRLLPALP